MEKTEKQKTKNLTFRVSEEIYQRLVKLSANNVYKYNMTAVIEDLIRRSSNLIIEKEKTS